QLARCVGPEREGAERDGTAAGHADFVHALERRQKSLDVGDGPSSGYASTGDADPVAHEQEAVTPSDADEVDIVVEWASRGFHRRVAVSNCVIPPDRRRRPTEENPASPSEVTRSSADGR